MAVNIPIYTITSHAKGTGKETLFLNADNNNNITVQYHQTPTSEWYLFYYPDAVDSASMPGAVILVNVAFGLALAKGSGDSLTLAPIAPTSSQNTFTRGSSAIRTATNENLNLNVRGDSYPPNTQVILFKWDNADNSKWNFNLVGSKSCA